MSSTSCLFNPVLRRVKSDRLECLIVGSTHSRCFSFNNEGKFRRVSPQQRGAKGVCRHLIGADEHGVCDREAKLLESLKPSLGTIAQNDYDLHPLCT